MKQYRFLTLGAAILVAVLVFLFSVATGRQQADTARLLTFQTAYPELAELPDFAYITVTEDSFLLCTPDTTSTVAQLPPAIAAMLHDRDLLNLRKTGDDVFFITSGAADDEWGYVITQDDAVSMDSLWHLDRVDSNIFYFSTMK